MKIHVPKLVIAAVLALVLWVVVAVQGRAQSVQCPSDNQTAWAVGFTRAGSDSTKVIAYTSLTRWARGAARVAEDTAHGRRFRFGIEVDPRRTEFTLHMGQHTDNGEYDASWRAMQRFVLKRASPFSCVWGTLTPTGGVVEFFPLSPSEHRRVAQQCPECRADDGWR